MKLRGKEIAEKLGVSPATVSLVLNDKPGVGDEMRKHILNYVRESGYTPTVAPAQIRKGNGTIQFIIYKKHGMVVGDNHFYSDIMEAVEHSARREGFTLSVTYLNEQTDHIPSVIRMQNNENPAAMIVLATEMDKKDIKYFRTVKVPLVFIDNYFEGQEFNMISIDNVQGLYQAMRYLKSIGHRNIGYVHSSMDIYNFKQRSHGFLNAVEANGLTFRKENLYEVQTTSTETYDALVEKLKKKPGITALFADNDTIAISVIKVLEAHGIPVPERVSIIGFDDMPFCDMVTPKLTSVHVQRRQMGYYAMERLLGILKSGSRETISMMVGTALTIRNSTANNRILPEITAEE